MNDNTQKAYFYSWTDGSYGGHGIIAYPIGTDLATCFNSTIAAIRKESGAINVRMTAFNNVE